MIIVGGLPCIAFGGVGISAGSIASGGGSPSPLANDIDPGDTTSQLLWALLPPLIGTGATTVTDAGAYSLLNPAPGTWVQHYRLVVWPVAAAATVTDSTITIIVVQAGSVGFSGKVMLRWSDDSGQTWSNYYTADLGSTGDTQTRVMFRRLGASRDRVYEISVSDAVNRDLVGGTLWIE